MALSGLEQAGMVVYIGKVIAGTDFEVPLMKPQRTIEITRLGIASDAAVTSNATNYFIGRLRRSATECISTISTDANSLTAREFNTVGVCSAKAQVQSCHHMYFHCTYAGAGVAVENLTLLVNYEVIGN